MSLESLREIIKNQYHKMWIFVVFLNIIGYFPTYYTLCLFQRRNKHDVYMTRISKIIMIMWWLGRLPEKSLADWNRK